MDTFWRWVEAFSTTNEKAQIVCNLLLQEIIPQFGVPASLQSDNGPECTMKIPQIIWSPGHPLTFSNFLTPQVFRKGRKTNLSLNIALVKLSQEIYLNWAKLLLLALSSKADLPKESLFISLFKFMYGLLVLTSCPLSCSPLPHQLVIPPNCHLCSLLWNFVDHHLPSSYAFLCQCLSVLETEFFSPLQIISPHLSLSPKLQGPFKLVLMTPIDAKLKNSFIGSTGIT